jgi:hypothetical protein
MGILQLPGRAYDHIYGQFGWVGLTFAGLALVVTIVGVMIWFDRRK